MMGCNFLIFLLIKQSLWNGNNFLKSKVVFGSPSSAISLSKKFM